MRETSATKGGPTKVETFFNKGWRFEKVQDVFNSAKLNAVLKSIPPSEHYNLYYTVADCFEERGRKLKEQWVIPFDIDELNLLDDGAELKVSEHAARAACLALGVPYEETAVVFSGHGVQFFILLDTPIVSEDHFDNTREQYGLLCKRIQNKLVELNIPGKVDPSVWSKGRLMRLPHTENRKPNKINRTSVILQGNMVARAFDVVKESGVPLVEIDEVISKDVLKGFPKPDTPAVLKGCKFLVWNKEKPREVKEPEWYRAISVLSLLDNGRELCHEYSQGHPGYNHYETENKIDQALARAGPATCARIDKSWDGCHTCEFYGKVKSPILIKGPDYIASKDFGFRWRNKDGKPTKPDYLDLIKQFTLDHPYKVVADNFQVIIYNGKHWEYMEDPFINQWMANIVRPEPNGAELREFLVQLKSYNVLKLEKLNEQVDGHLNFKNCVLNIRTLEVLPHSPDYGFFNVLDYDYDPRATSPRWDLFLKEIMSGDEEMAELLKEIGGYCISGDSCWLQKAAVFIGTGENGKSVFMEMLGEVVGDSFHGAVPMQELNNSVMRYQLVNKLFNYSEETSVRALQSSETFKTLVTGGKVAVKQLYQQPYLYANRAKIIISANETPMTNDLSHGFMRRLVLVHFNEKFERGDPRRDPFLKEKLAKELPGICNGFIKAYREVQKRGEYIGQEKTTKALMKYQEENDTVLMFVNEHLITTENENDFVKNTEAYEYYRMKCEMNGHKPLNNVHFFRSLHKHTPNITKEKIKKNTVQMRVLKGVRLNKEF